MIQQIHDIAAQLQAAYPKDEAEALAWWIAEETTGLSRTQLQIGCKGTTNFSNLQEIIDRLLHFEPIQYIFGHTLWCGLDLKVTPATLIPRPETAELVESIQHSVFLSQGNDYFSNQYSVFSNQYSVFSNQYSVFSNQYSECRVLDIGTGSGCIAIALKKKHPEWQVTGIDISKEAIEVAKENAKRNGVEVEFEVADIFDSRFSIIDYRYDLIVSNPPYICESEKVSMKPNVLNHEPATALFVPDDDPLRFYRRIATLAANRSPLVLFFEINEAYPQEVSAMLESLGYSDIKVTNDMYGKPRIIEGRMAG